jgi:hypothetical protein
MNVPFKAVSAARCFNGHRHGSTCALNEETVEMLALLIAIAVFGALLLDAIIYVVTSIDEDAAGI